MDLALWIVAGLLTLVFLVAGGNKLFISRQTLAKAPGGGWVVLAEVVVEDPDRADGVPPAAQRHTEAQSTAFLIRVVSCFSTAGVSLVRANAVGHIAPSSRVAVSLKPRVA